MSVINDLIPKFYFTFDQNLTQAELALIAPKKVDEPITLFLEDVIFLEENEPPSDTLTSRHGFHAPHHVSHKYSVLPTKVTTQHQVENFIKTNYKVALFDEATKDMPLSFAREIQHQDSHQEMQNQIVLEERVYKEKPVLIQEKQIKTPVLILPPAVVKHHYQIATHLLKQGYIDSHQAIKQNAKFLFSLMVSDLTDQMSDYIKSPSNSTLFKIDNLLNTIELFAEHSANICYIPDLASKAGITTYTPLSLVLKVFASLAPDHALMTKLKTTAEYIAQIDSTESQYLHAKYLLHLFPTGKTYDLAHQAGESIPFQSEGCYTLFTTKMVKDSLVAFTDKLQSENAAPLEQTVFKELVNIFSQASLSCEKRVLGETADELNQLYQHDTTVLLPSGWQGHCVDIALSKPQSLYLFSNSGEPSRYDDNTQSISGDTFRHLNQPSKIDAAFFHEVLTNTHKQFEQIMLIKYDMSTPIDVIEKPVQHFETCALDSHRDAVEGLLYIELRNQHIEANEAKILASEFFHHWDNFNAEFVIDGYMKNQPSLPATVLMDIQQSLWGQGNSVKLPENVSLETQKDHSTAPATPDATHFCPIHSPLEPVLVLPEPILA